MNMMRQSTIYETEDLNSTIFDTITILERVNVNHEGKFMTLYKIDNSPYHNFTHHQFLTNDANRRRIDFIYLPIKLQIC